MTPEEWLQRAEAAWLPINSKSIARAASRFTQSRNGRHEITVSRSELNRRLGFTNAQQTKAWRILLRDGWLAVTETPSGQRRYTLTIPTRPNTAPEGSANDPHTASHQ